MTPLDFVDAPPAPTAANFLLFGPPGSGKSTAAATLAPLGPILWLNAEGPGALAYPRKLAGKAIHEVRIDDHTTDVVTVVRDFAAHVMRGDEPRPATVVVDTLAKLRDALIRQLVQPGARNSIQQFGEVAKVISGLVRVLRDAPVNVVLIAHENIDDADGERVVRPLIGGVLTDTIPGEMDIVTYTGAVPGDEGTVRYVGQLVEARGRRCKDRSGGLGQFRDLDLAEWLGAYTRALAPDGDMPWAEGEPEVEGEPAQESLA